MEATPASHGVSGLVFLKLDILKLSKEVFEVDNVITTKRTKKSAFTLFQTSSPLFYFSHSGFRSEKFLLNIRKRKSLSCVHVPHKTKIGTFYVVFLQRIRRQLNSVLRYFLSGVVHV